MVRKLRRLSRAALERGGSSELIAVLDRDAQWYLDDRRPQGSINAVGAWEASGCIGDPEITIAFVDDDFDIRHPNLSQVAVCGTSYFDGEENPHYLTGKDAPKTVDPGSSFHGTACLGLALGIPTDELGIAGVAPLCSAFLVRGFPVGTGFVSSYIQDVFNDIASKCDVICLPLHPDPFVAAGADQSRLPEVFERLVQTGGRRGNGIVVCASAGNDHMPIVQNFPADYEFVPFMKVNGKPRKKKFAQVYGSFAAGPHVLAIAASSAVDRHSDYSNYGPEVTIAVPSNDYRRDSTRRNVRQNLLDDHLLRVPWNRNRRGNVRGGPYRDDFGGTSASTAIAAGAAALIRSVNPDLTALQVMEIIKDTARKVVQEDPSSLGEYGPSGRSYWFGHGRLDLRSAVEKARKTRGQTRPARASKRVRRS